MMRGVIDIRARTAQHVRAHQHSRYDLLELEYSDYGRDPRFLPGWWIVPMCFLTVVGVWVCLSV
jgi:hypothetical protein